MFIQLSTIVLLFLVHDASCSPLSGLIVSVLRGYLSEKIIVNQTKNIVPIQKQVNMAIKDPIQDCVSELRTKIKELKINHRTSNNTIYLLTSFAARTTLRSIFYFRTDQSTNRLEIRSDIDQELKFVIKNDLQIVIENTTIAQIESAEQDILTFVGEKLWKNKQIVTTHIRPYRTGPFNQVEGKFVMGIGSSANVTKTMLIIFRQLQENCKPVYLLRRLSESTGLSVDSCSFDLTRIENVDSQMINRDESTLYLMTANYQITINPDCTVNALDEYVFEGLVKQLFVI